MRACLCLVVVCSVVMPASVASSEPVLLETVPATGWDRPYIPVQMLQVALAAMGCEESYDDLMVTSGAAFRMAWRDRNFTFPALTLYQQDPVSVGAAIAGASVARQQFDSLEAAFTAIVESIDGGMPVIAWDDGRVDMQVICGYDADDMTVLRRNIDTGADAEPAPVECARAMPWAGARVELWLLDYTPPQEPLQRDWPLILANALRLADWPDEERLHGCFFCGDAAYYAWATDLRDSRLHADFPQAGAIAWRLAWQMQHARSTAARVLQANAVVHPAVLEAGLLYQDEAAIFGDVQRVLCGGADLAFAEAGRMADEQIRHEEVRLEAADLVERALEKDQAARAALTRALQDLAPELLPEAGGEPAEE